MNSMASKGLRTLIFGMKELSSDWDHEKLMDVKDLEILEDGIRLLGVTGLEDLLQDNVAECIRDFRTARIKVWMLTGDKGETAHNIGISCGLVDPENHSVFEIKSEELRGIADEIEFVNKKVMSG